MTKVWIEETEVIPSHYHFDEYLPWACIKRQFPAIVNLLKVYQNDGAQTSTSKANKRNQITKLLPVKELYSCSSQDSTTSIATVKTVTIYTVYDNNDNLVQLKFDNNRVIHKMLLKIIGLIIQFQTHLTNITINKGINNSGIEKINTWLSTTNITDVCLDDTFIADANYEILLENDNCLRQLSLVRCRINDEDLKKIASKLLYPLPGSKTLVILKLTSNKITDDGAKSLTEAFRTNRRLAYLNLADNLITDEGFIAMLDVLHEFPLLKDEVLGFKARKRQYIKGKNELVSKMMVELRAEVENRSLKSLTNVSIATTSSKGRGRVSVKELLIKSVDGDKKCVESMIQEKAKAITDKRMGDFVDPFSSKDINVKGDNIHCYGNNSLAYLNLSYNDISYLSVKKLLAVLSYQKIIDRKPRGLVNVSIEGNCIPEHCIEFNQIDEILDSNLTLSYKRQSKKKFSRAPSSIR